MAASGLIDPPCPSCCVLSARPACWLCCTPQAAQNAAKNNGAMKSKLVVAEAFADQGPILKRFRCRAQGR
jgi:hypothetical protein